MSASDALWILSAICVFAYAGFGVFWVISSMLGDRLVLFQPRELEPEDQWRIDYARNELVNATTPPTRLPIQPGEDPLQAVKRLQLARRDSIYVRLDK